MSNRIWARVAGGLALAGIVGCNSQGLSPRENGMQTYSQVVQPAPLPAIATAAAAANTSSQPMQISPVAGAAGPVRLQLPARVSVVQLGEIAPPDSMLTALRGHAELFSAVSAQTGVCDATDKENSPGRLDQMRAMARNLGSQYLLVFGGNIDSGRQETGLSIVNLTIVGAFVVPSTGVAVSGKAAGSLVDVETGRVLMNFSADTKGSGLAAAAFAANAETVAIDQAKQTLVEKLTADVVSQLGAHAKSPLAMAR